MHRIAMLLVIVAALSSACDDAGSGDPASPTAPPATATRAPEQVATPEPTPTLTPLPTIAAGQATIDGCPVDDEELCQFAIELQDALNAADATPVTRALAPYNVSCAAAFTPLGEDIGCPSTDDLSDPVALLIGFASDCCYFRPERFAEELNGWLLETEEAGSWRLYGVVPLAPLWDGGAGVILVRGSGDGAFAIEAGTLPRDGAISVPGVAYGAFNLLLISPNETLRPWP